MILTRTFTSELHVRDDDRVITGTLVPYGEPVRIREYGKTYTEDFAPGAFAADVARANEIELTALHPLRRPAANRDHPQPDRHLGRARR
jgi:hypothetical protein